MSRKTEENEMVNPEIEIGVLAEESTEAKEEKTEVKAEEKKESETKGKKYNLSNFLSTYPQNIYAKALLEAFHKREFHTKEEWDAIIVKMMSKKTK